jgi:hypothetical protein
VTALRRVRRILTAVVALGVLLTVVSTHQPSTPDVVPAADLSAFRPGNIISNAVFYDSTSMSPSQIQTFLNGQGASCLPVNGVPCLKDYVMGTSTRPADEYCAQYTGAARETAAQIIANVGRACDINPRVLLVTLQKEQGLVTKAKPEAADYRKAMGYACPDTAGCDTYYNGFFNQLYSAAKQFQRYTARPTRYGYAPGVRTIPYQVKGADSTKFNYQNKDCLTSQVNIENQATANLYNYTPYQPNAAALAAGYGQGNRCSAYGNRNFWNYFTDWFGSTYTGGYDPDAPIGRVDTVRGAPGSLTVTGWVFDPNARTTAVNVHVYVDGRLAGAVSTGTPRGDVASANPGVGPDQGFAGSVDAEPGNRTACLYAVNVAEGWTNTRLGCATVSVATTESLNPKGALDSASVSGSTVSVSGWAVDPDALAEPLRVHLYVDGKAVAGVTADGLRADVGTANPGAGDNHGYSWSGTLAAGKHQVCAFALNRAKGTGNPLLGCRSVTVASAAGVTGSGSPVGRLDGVAVSGTTATLHGWTFDPDVPASPVQVHVYVDGRVVAATTANNLRADVGRTYPAAGNNHGYAWSGTLSAGNHQVCTFAINQGSRAVNPRLGCRTVTVAATTPTSPTGTAADRAPVGRLDGVTVSGSSVTAGGWAYDPDVPTTALRVHVYVDGQAWAAVTANGTRADIGRAHPGVGDAHGYSATGTLPAGAHQVCAYGINQGGGTGNALLGCRAVTVP